MRGWSEWSVVVADEQAGPVGAEETRGALVGELSPVDVPDVDAAGVDEAADLPPGGRAPAPTPPVPAKSVRRNVVEWIVLIAAAVVIALLIKTYLFQAFYIPSESMVPTLEIGDRVLVNKLSYDLHSIHRGDIVVFRAAPKIGRAHV